MATKRATPGQVIDLATFPSEHPGKRSRALVKTPEMEVICVNLAAGDALPPHQVSGPITVQCVRGAISFSVNGVAAEMSAGQWLFLEADTEHAVEALEDASILVTILFKQS